MQLAKLVPGYFVQRNNRFRVTVIVDGIKTAAHLPNSGKLSDLLTPHRRVWLTRIEKSHRKTAYDMTLVELDTGLVSIDARLPNKLFVEAVTAGRLPDLSYSVIEPEVRADNSRLDYRLCGSQGCCWLETKSVTLVDNRVALFPDVPTTRGSRHLITLLQQRRRGDRAVVVFVIQRPDAVALAPHRQADPDFATTLELAVAGGVEAKAFTCRVSQDEIELAHEVPVILGEEDLA